MAVVWLLIYSPVYAQVTEYDAGYNANGPLNFYIDDSATTTLPWTYTWTNNDFALGEYIQAKSLRSEEHTSELQSRENLVCRLLPLPISRLFPYTTLFRS